MAGWLVEKDTKTHAARRLALSEDSVVLREEHRRRCAEEGVRFIVISGGNPSAQLPLSGLINRRGDALAALVEARIAGRDDLPRSKRLTDWLKRTTALLSQRRRFF